MKTMKIIFTIIITTLLVFQNLKAIDRNISEADTSKQNSISGSHGDSYAENVHMYICIEALKLLKDRYPNLDFSMFDTRIGTTGDCGERPWQYGTITSGACREDKEDVVFDIRGPGNFYASNSHFWDADNRSNGDNSLTTLNIGGNPIDYPNAYTKMNRYISGQWHDWTGSGYSNRNFINYVSAPYIYKYSYHTRGLIDFFRTKKILLYSRVTILGQETVYNYEVTLDNTTFHKIVWEILGRMSHLLGDLSVPAHTHNDVHVNEWDGGDCYHNYIDNGAYQNYNWQTAKQFGGFINPYETSENPIRYLMYTASQLAQHFPSGPSCTVVPQQHPGNNNLPGGTNAMLQNYYSALGDPPEHLFNLSGEASYCFNHAIRSTAGLFYWFATETQIIPPDPAAYPKISGFHQSQIDDRIYRGETLKLICNATGANLNYNWFVKVCDTTKICNLLPPGLSFTPNGNEFNIKNISFKNKYICDYYDSLCRGGGSGGGGDNSSAYPPLKFYVGVRVFNNLGTVTRFYDLTGPSSIQPLESLRVYPPPPSGCPVLLTFNGSEYEPVNNLLPVAEYEENQGKEFVDKVLINNSVVTDPEDSTISLAIIETENAVSKFNQIEVTAVDHPENTKIGITASNEIVMYHIDKINSSSFAEISGRDVTKQLEYDTAYSDNVKGESKQILNAYFENVQKPADADYLCLLLDASPPALAPPPIKKERVGYITFTYDNGHVKSEKLNLGRRELRSDILISSPINSPVSSIETEFIKDFNLSYAAIVPLYKTGFTIKNLQLYSAEHNKEGNIFKSILLEDRKHAPLDSSSFIVLKFKSLNERVPKNFIRSYVFSSKGSVTTSQTDAGTIISGDRTQIANSYKLNLNYPNPFNPVTNISYDLPEASDVSIVIYDVLGKETARLVNSRQDAGSYSILFDGSNLSSGIYYCKLIANGSVKGINKMLLLK